MILTCPECATRYDVDAAKFPAAGRKVRCKNCSHVWFQPGPENDAAAQIVEVPAEPQALPPEPVAEAAPEPAVEPEHIRSWRESAAEARSYESDDEDDTGEEATPAAAPRARRSRAGVFGTIIGWVALVGAILVIGWAATSYHQQIATTWPKSASLFTRMGMKVNTRGLDFADVRHTSQTEDGQPVLVISGKLVNVSARPIKVPSLRVTLSNETSRAIYGWSFAPGTKLLAPGQSLAFHTRLSNPPAAARHVDIRFGDGVE